MSVLTIGANLRDGMEAARRGRGPGKKGPPAQLKTISDRVAMVLFLRGMGPALLDRVLGKSSGYSSRLLAAADRNPKSATVIELARALRVSPTWLLLGTEGGLITRSPVPAATAEAFRKAISVRYVGDITDSMKSGSMSPIQAVQIALQSSGSVLLQLGLFSPDDAHAVAAPSLQELILRALLLSPYDFVDALPTPNGLDALRAIGLAGSLLRPESKVWPSRLDSAAEYVMARADGFANTEISEFGPLLHEVFEYDVYRLVSDWTKEIFRPTPRVEKLQLLDAEGYKEAKSDALKRFLITEEQLALASTAQLPPGVRRVDGQFLGEFARALAELQARLARQD